MKERYKGKELEYKEYEPLFDCALEICKKQKKKAYYITCGDFVTLTDGTGVVHIAPRSVKTTPGSAENTAFLLYSL